MIFYTSIFSFDQKMKRDFLVAKKSFQGRPNSKPVHQEVGSHVLSGRAVYVVGLPLTHAQPLLTVTFSNA